MKHLLMVTALIEAGAGVVLMYAPSMTVGLLLGSPLETPAAVALGRIAGTALFALGVANWLAHDDEHSRATTGLVTAMWIYNSGATLVLTAAGIKMHGTGIALWPAVILHAAMSIWCFTSLRRKPASNET